MDRRTAVNFSHVAMPGVTDLLGCGLPIDKGLTVVTEPALASCPSCRAAYIRATGRPLTAAAGVTHCHFEQGGEVSFLCGDDSAAGRIAMPGEQITCAGCLAAMEAKTLAEMAVLAEMQENAGKPIPNASQDAPGSTISPRSDVWDAAKATRQHIRMLEACETILANTVTILDRLEAVLVAISEHDAKHVEVTE